LSCKQDAKMHRQLNKFTR